MGIQYVLSDYINLAMAQAVYDKLANGTIAGRIHICSNVLAFGNSLGQCEYELRSTLKEWILLGPHLGQLLPVIEHIT